MQLAQNEGGGGREKKTHHQKRQNKNTRRPPQPGGDGTDGHRQQQPMPLSLSLFLSSPAQRPHKRLRRRREQVAKRRGLQGGRPLLRRRRLVLVLFGAAHAHLLVPPLGPVLRVLELAAAARIVDDGRVGGGPAEPLDGGLGVLVVADGDLRREGEREEGDE